MSPPRPNTGAVVLLASLALAAFAAAPASAAPAPAAPKAATFGLSAAAQSGALRLRGAPGQTVRGAVLVRNLSRRSIAVRLQPADIANATNGNADYMTVRRSAAGRWVRLAATTVRLAPKASRKVAFSIRVPGRHPRRFALRRHRRLRRRRRDGRRPRPQAQE